MLLSAGLPIVPTGEWRKMDRDAQSTGFRAQCYVFSWH